MLVLKTHENIMGEAKKTIKLLSNKSAQKVSLKAQMKRLKLSHFRHIYAKTQLSEKDSNPGKDGTASSKASITVMSVPMGDLSRDKSSQRKSM